MSLKLYSPEQMSYLFTEGTLSSYIATIRQLILDGIDEYSTEVILNTSSTALQKYYLEKFKPRPIELAGHDDIRPYTDLTKLDRFGFLGNFDDGPRFFDGLRTTYIVPFKGDPMFFSLRSRFSLGKHPKSIVEDSCLVFVYDTLLDDVEKTKVEFDSSFNLIRTCIDIQKSELDEYNYSFDSEVLYYIEERKKKASKVKSIASTLGFKVAPRETAFRIPIERKAVLPAVTTSVGDTTLLEGSYSLILAFLKDLCLGLERSPSVYSRMGETQIRDLFLIALNAAFEGRATGETFNKNGKTDILIREKNANIFIAECKFWDGKSKFEETVKQLFGYLTLRDSKACIMFFNRQKNSASVRSKMQECVTQHPNFKRISRAYTESQIRYVFWHPDDADKEIDITFMLLDVPETPST